MALNRRLFYLAGFDMELVKTAGIRSCIGFAHPQVDLGSPDAASQYLERILTLRDAPVLMNDLPDSCARYILGRIVVFSGKNFGDVFHYPPFDGYSIAVVNPAFVDSPHSTSVSTGLLYAPSEVVQLVASVSNIPKEGIEAVLAIPEQKPTIDFLREAGQKATEEYFAAINGDRSVEAAHSARFLWEMPFVRMFIKAKLYEPVITQLLEGVLSQ